MKIRLVALFAATLMCAWAADPPAKEEAPAKPKPIETALPRLYVAEWKAANYELAFTQEQIGKLQEQMRKALAVRESLRVEICKEAGLDSKCEPNWERKTVVGTPLAKPPAVKE